MHSTIKTMCIVLVPLSFFSDGGPQYGDPCEARSMTLPTQDDETGAAP